MTWSIPSSAGGCGPFCHKVSNQCINTIIFKLEGGKTIRGGGQEGRKHGGGRGTFKVRHDEQITRIRVRYGTYNVHIYSIQFTTDKGRVSEEFGRPSNSCCNAREDYEFKGDGNPDKVYGIGRIVIAGAWGTSHRVDKIGFGTGEMLFYGKEKKALSLYAPAPPGASEPFSSTCQRSIKEPYGHDWETIKVGADEMILSRHNTM